MEKKDNRILKLFRFLKNDIWWITGHEISGTRRIVYNLIKVIVIAFRGFINDKLPLRASALTYSILFAMVPMLSLFIAIGRGFGVENTMKEWIQDSFFAQKELIPILLGFVDRYLETAQGGVFIGIGLIILLISIVNFFRQIENSFNSIWEVTKKRNVMTQISTYISAIFLIPVLIVLSGGVKLFLDSKMADLENLRMITPFIEFGMKMTPFFVSSVVFTFMYIVIPYTKVKAGSSIIAGIIAGSAFQFFQNIYIAGQVYLSRYDMVYGSFAALPLLLLWLYVSAIIVLIGAEISYAGQNIKNYEYELDSKHVSNRYKSFLALFLTFVIVKRFENHEKPYNSDQIATKYKLPISLVNMVLTELADVRILSELSAEDRKTKSYQPAMDINQLTVSILHEKMNSRGSDLFISHQNESLDKFWKKASNFEIESNAVHSQLLIKDI